MNKNRSRISIADRCGSTMAVLKFDIVGACVINTNLISNVIELKLLGESNLRHYLRPSLHEFIIMEPLSY